ncbi:papain family cysteine protease [Ancylostoma caninum]|uniref:Papain family cysteine protease n=1 Tax=Ancylostoma caninum TaxID=29170 RepID=A0A368GRI5_ANCCA|nr:papain family cysteine protease [Ancylostoma caninum]
MLILPALVVTTLAKTLTVDELLTTPIPKMAQELKGKQLVDFVNHRQTSFTAEYSRNAERYLPVNEVDPEDVDNPSDEPEKIAIKAMSYHDAEELPALPESFDSREHWKNCSEIIDYIRDQSACGGCWAVAAASAMGDRACIASNGKFKKHLSDIDILTCCNDCGYGCSGGQALKAWNYAIREGVPTGGRYGTENTGGRDRGGHAVKIIGWGKENGTPYWLVANSYNFDWGENGYFRMIRGKNNCKIEEKVVAGTMDVDKYLN